MQRSSAAKFPIILFLLLFGPSCGEEIVLKEDEDLSINCTADTADEFEAILWEKAWLPDGYSQIFRLYAFGPLFGLEGLWLCYATLQNLIPSFPWNAPPRPPPWRNPRKGRDQILQRSVAEP